MEYGQLAQLYALLASVWNLFTSSVDLIDDMHIVSCFLAALKLGHDC